MTTGVRNFNVFAPGQSVGSVLFFDGARWAALPPGQAGQRLVARAGDSPAWTFPLAGRASGSAASPSSSLASYAVVPDMAVTGSSSGGPVLVQLVGSFNVQSGDGWSLGIFVDGALAPGSEVGNSFFGGFILGLTPSQVLSGSMSCVALVQPASGSHVYDARWRASGGFARADGTARQLLVVEL